jgi:hypothetical protein
MARDENLPFQLGSTFWGGVAADIDSTANAHLEGKKYVVEDDDISTGELTVQGTRSGKSRTVMIVRNMNATALEPREIAKMKVDGSTHASFVGQVDGLVASAADRGFPVDEYLPAGMWKQYDLGYVVVEGLAQVKTDSAGDTNIPAGAVVVPGAGTDGRIVQQDTTATGADLFNQIQNAIGRLTTTVNATSTTVTVDVGAHLRA